MVCTSKHGRFKVIYGLSNSMVSMWQISKEWKTKKQRERQREREMGRQKERKKNLDKDRDKERKTKQDIKHLLVLHYK